LTGAPSFCIEFEEENEAEKDPLFE